jgi:uncharacterized phage protein (TIGR02218 family)
MTPGEIPAGAVPGEKTFLPFQAPAASAITNDVSLAVSNTKYNSFFNIDGVKTSDIKAGRFENAEVYFYICNPSDATTVWFVQSGYIGGFAEQGGDTFSMDFRSIAQLLQQNVGKTVTENCPYKLGDLRCTVTPLTATAIIQEVDFTGLRRFFRIAQDNYVALTFGFSDIWRNGLVEVTNTDSPNYNVQIEVVRSDYLGAGVGAGNNFQITCLRSFPFDLQEGDTVRLLEGCGNTVTACQARGNILNFGGFPFLPGNDTLMASSIPDRSSAQPGGKK